MKIFELPLKFDENEWFIIISMIFSLICFIIVPKKIPRSMSVSILLFFGALGLTADLLIGVSYPIDFYTIMDSPKLELFDVIIYIFNYPLYGYLFAYFIYKSEKFGAYLMLSILFCGFNTLLEWISVKFNVFTYQNGWNLGYSAIAYLLIFTFCTVVVKIFSRCWKTD